MSWLAGTAPLKSSWWTNSTATLSTCGQLDAYSLNCSAWWKKISQILSQGSLYSPASLAIHSLLDSQRTRNPRRSARRMTSSILSSRLLVRPQQMNRLRSSLNLTSLSTMWDRWMPDPERIYPRSIQRQSHKASLFSNVCLSSTRTSDQQHRRPSKTLTLMTSASLSRRGSKRRRLICQSMTKERTIYRWTS